MCRPIDQSSNGQHSILSPKRYKILLNDHYLLWHLSHFCLTFASLFVQTCVSLSGHVCAEFSMEKQRKILRYSSVDIEKLTVSHRC